MSTEVPKFDLITIGRSSIDLYGEQFGGRLEDMRSFAKYIGGSPTNTAVGVSRLGLKAGLLTRVGKDHFGRHIREQLVREGVDVQGVLEDPDRLTSLVFLGIRDQDTFPLIFYRENCADMALCPDDIDEDWMMSAGAVLINGTHLSKSNMFDASLKACNLAKKAGRRVIFDIDYRPVLWGLTSKDMGENRFVSSSEVTSRLQEVLHLCDLVVGTEEEFHILGGSTDTISALKAVRKETSALLICKRGADGCSAFPKAIPRTLDNGVNGRGFQVEVFNVLGAGDAFMAGFLRGWLRNEPLETCCEYANACGAIVVSRHGCAPAIPTWEELKSFLGDKQRPFRLREDKELEHIHHATTRNGIFDKLCVLAIDHRSQFDEIFDRMGADRNRIKHFKSLAVQAVNKVANGQSGFGLLLDGRYGSRALEISADYPFWIGRPIELPGSRPLEFESSADVATELATWPTDQVVKCLVYYHPDDSDEMKGRQKRQLLRLNDAAQKTGHELLLEIIVSKHGNVDESTVAKVIAEIYDLGIKPDWWKLEPDSNGRSWANIEYVIRENDPYCRGVVLLGLAAPQEQLIESFKYAAKSPIIKGFAIGRTIFAEVVELWIAEKLTDEAVVDELAERFERLIQAWFREKNEPVNETLQEAV